MKKLIIIFCMMSVICSSLYVHSASHVLELKSSYLFFTQGPLQDIYSNGGIEEALSGSFALWKCLNIYTSVGVIYTHGKSLNNGEKTSLLQVPLDLGLKLLFPFHRKFDYYAGFGGRYSFVKQHNDSLFVDKNIHLHCGGFFLNSGFNIHLKKHWLLSIFGEYAYIKGSIKSHRVNVFGKSNLRMDTIAVGLSLGYSF